MKNQEARNSFLSEWRYFESCRASSFNRAGGLASLMLALQMQQGPVDLVSLGEPPS